MENVENYREKRQKLYKHLLAATVNLGKIPFKIGSTGGGREDEKKKKNVDILIFHLTCFLLLSKVLYKHVNGLHNNIIRMNLFKHSCAA